jgi:hypothetical protein
MTAREPGGIAGNYPDKKRLTQAEAMRVLADGPQLNWFHGWAERGIMLANLSQRWGFVHVIPDEDADQMRRYDIHVFKSRAELAWALEHLHKEHPACGDECLGLFYFTPDELLRLRLEIELDDEDEQESEQ